MANTMNGITSLSFILMLLMSVGLDKLYGLVNVMQIFVVFSLFEVSLTVEISVFFKYLIMIATFEMIDMGDYYEMAMTWQS